MGGFLLICRLAYFTGHSSFAVLLGGLGKTNGVKEFLAGLMLV
jgi:hypothetical protein